MSDEKSNNSVITPTTINVAQNRVNDNAGHNWATTISRYLLQRREQTQMAYQGQLVSHAFKEDNDSNAWLFETLFESLVQRLEEGHTVLVLDACKSEINANTPSDDNNNDNDNDDNSGSGNNNNDNDNDDNSGSGNNNNDNDNDDNSGRGGGGDNDNDNG